MTKRRDPTTMKTTRSSLGTKQQQSVDKLLKQFRNLEQDWNTFNLSKPRPLLRRCSTGSNAVIDATTLSLLENSPRSLMSSLQQRVIRSNDAAREEIIRDRRAAIESGKLKGRRLFGEVAGIGEREEISSGCFDLRSVCSYGSDNDDDGNGNWGSKEEVVSAYCCCSCGSSLSGERVEREEAVVVVGGEKVAGVNLEVVKREECGVGHGGGRWMLHMGWFSILLMVFSMGLIYMRCNGGDEDEVMVVPT